MNSENSSAVASELVGGLYEGIDYETGDQFWEEVRAFLRHAFVQEGEGFDLIDGGRHDKSCELELGLVREFTFQAVDDFLDAVNVGRCWVIFQTESIFEDKAV